MKLILNSGLSILVSIIGMIITKLITDDVFLLGYVSGCLCIGTFLILNPPPL